MDEYNNIMQTSKGITFPKVILLIICLALPLCVGIVSGMMTKDNMTVFDTISKPFLTPPAIVFPIAWMILYILMGLSSFFAIINCDDKAHVICIMFPYILQLILNFFWSIIFFNKGLYGMAFICLIFMWILILRTLFFFGSVSKLSYYLMMPYLIWVTFAGYLNISIVVLNR